MNVSAIIVTRGNVDMKPVIDSLPESWEKVIWNNGTGNVVRWSGPTGVESPTEHWEISDLSVYGRYAAIEYASHYVCYTQDDDVIVSDPQAIVDALVIQRVTRNPPLPGMKPLESVEVWMNKVVCNMPQEFRHDGYTDSALVGFGAAFHRDAPARAFERYYYADTLRATAIGLSERRGETFPHWVTEAVGMGDFFLRTCDVVFTTLTDRVLVDVPKVNREFAEDADRMYRQPDHVGERARMLYLAREARDA